MKQASLSLPRLQISFNYRAITALQSGIVSIIKVNVLACLCVMKSDGEHSVLFVCFGK